MHTLVAESIFIISMQFFGGVQNFTDQAVAGRPVALRLLFNKKGNPVDYNGHHLLLAELSERFLCACRKKLLFFCMCARLLVRGCCRPRVGEYTLGWVSPCAAHPASGAEHCG